MLYRKLKRVWSHNDMNYIPRFFDVFPELRHLSSGQLRDRFADLGLDFYSKEECGVKWYVRLTLPLAVLVMLTMVILMPVNFLFTGKWSYGFSDRNFIRNWFEMLF